MSNRLLKTLLGLLVGLLAAWGIARLVSGSGGRPEEAPFSLGMGGAAIDSAVIASSEDTVRIAAGVGWTVNGFEAISDAGESLERALEEAVVGQLASRNPENHGRLGVSEQEGRLLSVYSGGDEKLSVIIGGRARGVRGAYVRRPGADEVYTVQGTIVGLVSRAVDDWRERQILSVTRGDIVGIEYEYGDTAISLARDSTGWRLLPAGMAVEETAISSVVNQLSGLRAIGFAADTVADTLTWEPAARVRVVGPGEAVVGELTFLERAEDVGYYVRRAGTPVVYTLSKYSGDQILKREDDLVPEPAEPSESSETGDVEEPVEAADTAATADTAVAAPQSG
jgi:hypothetical protein